MEGLDIVAFCAQPAAYRLVAHWAALNRHRLLLVVTEPAADGERYDAGSGGLAAALPPEQDVLATRRLRTTVAAVVSALKPDVIVSASFPRRIPAEVAAIPRYGAIDLQVSPLPHGRGPIPEGLGSGGVRSVAVTARRLAPGSEAGPILALRERRLPEVVASDQVRAAWRQVVAAALDEAVARAAAGDPGERWSDGWVATTAPTADGVRWLPRAEPERTIRRPAANDEAALGARARIGGEDDGVLDVRTRGGAAPDVPLEQASTVAVAVPDGEAVLAVAP